MITEKRLAQSYQSFWKAAIPMATSYVRRRNRELAKFAEPVSSSGDDNRGLINEIGFKLFAASRAQSTTVRKLGADAVAAAVEEALDFIRRFREYSRARIGSPSEVGVREAKRLGERLERFVRALQASQVVVSPAFVGCGWLDECSGDLLLDDMLCEVKASGGRFRSRDLRQILIYAALNSQMKTHSIKSVCLVNPRLGLFLQENLEELCFELAGTSSHELLGEIISFVSEPRWTDMAV